jgi:NAD(P)-dependent dehydrogenase (short-subunit alcohol dehydrogenase family)
MLARNPAKANAAADAVRSAANNPRVHALLADLGDMASVRKAAAEFKVSHDRLDVLLNIAALFKSTRAVTVDGLEAMFATNHLGPFLLTNLLLDVLKRSAPARVINVTAPSTTELDFDDLQGQQKFSALRAFGASKMCNLLFTHELARRLDGTGITVNALHPGLVKSELMREAPLPIRVLVRLVSKSPDAAAAALLHLGSSPALEQVTGRFFKVKQEMHSPRYSLDEAVQHRLWEKSVELVGLGT